MTREHSTHLQPLLAAFRQIGMPLLQALVENPAHAGAGEANKGANSEQFQSLVDSTILLSQKLTTEFGGDESGLDAGVRWALAGSASQVVGAHFRATGRVMADAEAEHLASIAASLQEKFRSQIPTGGETIPNTVATFRAKMMEAMVPVIGAVAQFSFGRAEHGLLAEIAERLVKTADQVTRALAPAGATPEQWRYLCWSILRSAGQIYAECHYAEADRLLYLDQEAQAAYFAQHSNIVPMTQVWQGFNQRMAMLATLATFLEVPASAQLEQDGLA